MLPKKGDVMSSTASPLYRSSVVGTDFDFITESDPDAFQHAEYVDFNEFEMPERKQHRNEAYVPLGLSRTTTSTRAIW
jgi:hypothetical protein